jgi:hypothetical protein
VDSNCLCAFVGVWAKLPPAHEGMDRLIFHFDEDCLKVLKDVWFCVNAYLSLKS